MVDVASPFELSDRVPCLDFANTWTEEAGFDYGDLVAWSVAAGLMDEAAAERLLLQANATPADAESVLASARELAASIRAVFGAIAAGHEPSEAHIDSINRALACALPRLALRKAEGCCTWTWSGPENSLDRMLWPLVHSTADLLTSDLLDRVRECAAPSCVWLFLDQSRNRQRKWCDMATCGNRAKAQRYYHRHRDPRRS